MDSVVHCDPPKSPTVEWRVMKECCRPRSTETGTCSCRRGATSTSPAPPSPPPSSPSLSSGATTTWTSTGPPGGASPSSRRRGGEPRSSSCTGRERSVTSDGLIHHGERHLVIACSGRWPQTPATTPVNLLTPRPTWCRSTFSRGQVGQLTSWQQMFIFQIWL